MWVGTGARESPVRVRPRVEGRSHSWKKCVSTGRESEVLQRLGYHDKEQECGELGTTQMASHIPGILQIRLIMCTFNSALPLMETAGSRLLKSSPSWLRSQNGLRSGQHLPFPQRLCRQGRASALQHSQYFPLPEHACETKPGGSAFQGKREPSGMGR